MTDKIQEIIKLLRMCGGDGQCIFEDCMFYGEDHFCRAELVAADIIEQLSNKLEAALSIIKNALRNSVESCDYRKNHQECEGEKCPYYCGYTLQNEYGDVIKAQLACKDFDYGICPLLENIPCVSCDFDCNWKLNCLCDTKEEIC